VVTVEDAAPEERGQMVKFEPMLAELLELDELEAQIVAFLFYRGGAVTKDELFRTLKISRMSIQSKTDVLLERQLVQQNDEVKPTMLTLATILPQLRELMEKKRSHQVFALKFLRESLDISSKDELREGMKWAFEVLLDDPKQAMIAEVLTLFYMQPVPEEYSMSLTELKTELAEKGHEYTESSYKGFMTSRRELFQVFHDRVPKFTSSLTHQRPKITKEMQVRVRWSLAALIQTLDLQNQLLYEQYTAQLNELEELLEARENYIHRTLPNRFSINRKLEHCLSRYKEVCIIDNGVYSNQGATETLLHLIAENSMLTEEHDIRVLSSAPVASIEVPGSLKERKINVEIRRLESTKLEFDYRERDMILCQEEQNPRGCFVFPPQDLTPYYNIAPSLIKKVAELFEANWRS
jgi:hypothetical protein